MSGHHFKAVNRILLACLGYERNLFLTSKQLKSIDGAILAEEKPHIISYLSDGSDTSVESSAPDVEDTKKDMKRRYYTVFNIAQCRFSADMVFPEVNPELDPIIECAAIKSKSQTSGYYDPLRDFINLPHEDNYESKEAYCYDRFHQLMHSTGHHSRLNRKDLIQMSEFGYDSYSPEELLAEIGTAYLMSHHGLSDNFVPGEEYLKNWIKRFTEDKYLIFSAATQAERAINFLFLGDAVNA